MIWTISKRFQETKSVKTIHRDIEHLESWQVFLIQDAVFFSAASLEDWEEKCNAMGKYYAILCPATISPFSLQGYHYLQGGNPQ